MSGIKPTHAMMALALLVASAGLASPPATKSPPPPSPSDAQAKRVGDAYPFDVCPISGKKLGGMGDPVVKVYDGREVRFCCGMCPAKFEKDVTASLATLDEKIVKDQAPLYPLTTSVVSDKSLSEKPVQFVYGNRLVRLADESEKAAFMKNSKKYFESLDKAVIAKQSKDYPLTKCPVSGEDLGGDMGKPKDLVLAGRLVRLCCGDCVKDIEKDPAKYVKLVDDARSKASAKPGVKPEAKP